MTNGKRALLEPPNAESSAKRPRLQPPRHLTLTSAELGIVKLAADVLGISVDDLLRLSRPHSYPASSASLESSNTYIDSDSSGDGQDALEVGKDGDTQRPSATFATPRAADVGLESGGFDPDWVPDNQPLINFTDDFHGGGQDEWDWWDIDSNAQNESGGSLMTATVKPTILVQGKRPTGAMQDWHQGSSKTNMALQNVGNTENPWAFPQQDLQGNSTSASGSLQPKTASMQPQPSLLSSNCQLQEWPGGQMLNCFEFESGHNENSVAALPQANILELDDDAALDPRTVATSMQKPQQTDLLQIKASTSGTEMVRTGSHQRNGSEANRAQKARRRGPLTPAQRLKTSLTRKTGACIRCQRQQIKCEPDPENPLGCCMTCRNVSGPTLTSLTCWRYKISDSQLIDKGPHPRFIWTQRWKSMKIVEIDQWQSPEIRTITLTQDIGATYNLHVRKFDPVEGDSLNRAWKLNGTEKAHACTPWAIANMTQTGHQIALFAENHIRTFINFYIKKTDKLMWETYNMAHQYSRTAERKEERDLLRSTLKLWVASRMESRRERICGEEVLDMSPQDWDPHSDNYGSYLIAPVLQAQIELLTTCMVLLPMKQAVLKSLQTLMKANQTRSWFAIYLCMFILLHSCSLLTKAESARANREPQPSPSHIQASFYDPRLVEDFHNGAKIMLAHFHYSNKGNFPFLMDWRSPGIVVFAELNASQAKFMQETTEEIKQRAERFKYVKDNELLEDDYFFVSQLYESNWKPRHTL